MSDLTLLSRRSVSEIMSNPAATIPALLIPVFFLVVNVGQVTRVFTTQTSFLHGQHYVAFAVPVSIVFAVSSAASGLATVNDIGVGYLDKLRAAPIRRSSIVWGRLAADLARGAMVTVLVLAIGFALGARIRSGLIGIVLIVVLAALWGAAYAGIAMSIAFATRSAQATNASFLIFFPLLFLTPNFVPLDMLATPLRVVARINPVTYVIEGLRDLVLQPDIHWGSLASCVGVIVVVGALLTMSCLRGLARLDD